MRLDDLTRTIRTNIHVCEECGCWVWHGSTDTSGYAKAKMRGRSLVVHTYVWTKVNGPVPSDGDMTLDHRSCTSHRCCNPDHLELVTRTVNAQRANATRFHNLKFDLDGNAIEHKPCTLCSQLPARGQVPTNRRKP